ncbi:hypothetical protein UZ36_01960 [Candidatus Nitromaritima sp. SCGC AAA799-C22]|nr:hypothetical protein UZ36_01960 [Candidatus Nitromaritima sp. SCGC AAA799-C22]
MNPKGYFISGTDTGVGKTVVTACLLALFRKRGVDTGVMKPIETGVDPECGLEANSDARFLLAVSGHRDTLEEVCPARLKPAAAPLQAARMANRELEIAPVLENFQKLQTRHDQMLVEGVGGLRVPLRSGYFVSDLVRDMGLPLIVVSRVTLGTLNHTLLTLNAAREAGIEVAGVILNRVENRKLNEVERGQADLIEELSGVRVLGECPFIEPVTAGRFDDKLAGEIETWINL